MGRLSVDAMGAALRKFGCVVEVVPGAATRGSDAFNPGGVVGHHTAGSPYGDRPTLNLVVEGRSDLDGPLCNVFQARSGAAVIVAAGRANHAGRGGFRGLVGNSSVFGIEAESKGTEPNAWTPAQVDSYPRIVAGLLWLIGQDESWYCFPADVLVLTRRGQVSIAEVTTDDEVWTHQGRWRRVTRTGSRAADTIVLTGHGHPGLTTTAEHPFRAVRTSRGRTEGSNSHNSKRWREPEWINASDMTGVCWLSPTHFPDETPAPDLTPEQAWLIGHWLAEGSFAGGNGVIHTCHPNEAAEVAAAARAADVGVVGVYPHGASTQIRVGLTRERTAWLRAEFGAYAHGKTLPGWVLSAPEKQRQAMLDGYLFGDGHEVRPGIHEASSVSKPLALGIKLLAQSLGYWTALYRHPPGRWSIQGRTGASRELWIVKIRTDPCAQSHGVFLDEGYATTVRQVNPGGRQQVYNLSVADDESFVADGFIVHNCTHRTWAPDRKIDTVTLTDSWMRDRVGALLRPAPMTVLEGEMFRLLHTVDTNRLYVASGSKVIHLSSMTELDGFVKTGLLENPPTRGAIGDECVQLEVDRVVGAIKRSVV